MILVKGKKGEIERKMGIKRKIPGDFKILKEVSCLSRPVRPMR